MTDKPLEYITVPAGSRASECRGKGCGAVIYWIERLSRSKKTPGRTVRVPVDCSHDEQCESPTSDAAGIGVNHFQTCPDANRF